MGFGRQLRSFVLPFVMVLVIPFFLTARLSPFRVGRCVVLPHAQDLMGIFVFLIGLYLLVATVRLFVQEGRGTLAPWDPTTRLVVRGPYGRVRNPMIAGVLFMILGEAIFIGSLALFCWFVFFWMVNTIYFRLSEEPGLERRFGNEYREYRANVPMWIPRVRPWVARR